MKYAFKRKEEKFILPLTVADSIKLIVKHDMSFSEHNQGGSLTSIRTTYFENDEYLIYHMKKSKRKKRFKVRIREYGFNGNFESSIWIELKEKSNGQGYKSRFKINRKYIHDFIDGRDIFEHVLKKNKDVNKKYLSILYRKIQSLIIDNKLYPRLIMQYQRLALQTEGPKAVRLTFDYNLKGGILDKDDELFKPIKNPEYFDRYKSVVELKIGTVYPELAKGIKKKFNIKKQKFSKFVFGMESCITDFYQPPVNNTDKYVPMSEIMDLDREYDI